MVRAPIAISCLLSACAASVPAPKAPGHAPLVDDIDAALERSARWLLGRQGEDGGWHSKAYSPFSDGRALTPVVLSTLLFAGRVPGLDAAYAQGSDFVATLAGPNGELVEGPYGLDYPIYSLSGAILVLSVPVNQRHEAARDTLVRHLRARQLVEPLGWTEVDPPFGGWGYYRDLPKKPPPDARPDQLLTSNMAATLFAVGALALAEVPLDDPAFRKAEIFVKRCQNFGDGKDGGFFFTPKDATANKAGPDPLEGGFRSYGTATADGIRALLRVGVSRNDPRVQAAARWLGERFDAERVPGDYPPDREVQRDSAYFYWTWTSAHALMLLGPMTDRLPRTVDWPKTLAKALLSRQSADGSFRNSAVDMREDDPLVATPLAAAALSICRLMLKERFETAVSMGEEAGG